MQNVAVVTMVRDDAFFLRTWLRHYGGMFGRENCYVVNHGRGEEVATLAAGCNVIGIPGDPHKNFDIKRWQLLNNLVSGLRKYYRYVIVGDVDELVVLDPEVGTLPDFIADLPKGRVLTPIGLEVIHRIDRETAPIEDHVLGPRRHVRPAPSYSKPCLTSHPAKLSRGGHYAQYDQIHTPRGLYLLHLKFCDFGVYSEAMDRRNAVTEAVGTEVRDTAIGQHWFAQNRGEDRALFEQFAELEEIDGFDLAPLRRRMRRSFRPRGDTGYYEFDRPPLAVQYVLPERFNGMV